MAFQNILSTSGPLPLTAQFNSPVDGPVDVIVTSTAWSASQVGLIGIEILIDGAVLGSTMLYANNTGMHMTLPAIFATANLTQMNGHTVELAVAYNGAGTTTDSNDFFTVNLQY